MAETNKLSKFYSFLNRELSGIDNLKSECKIWENDCKNISITLQSSMLINLKMIKDIASKFKNSDNSNPQNYMMQLSFEHDKYNERSISVGCNTYNINVRLEVDYTNDISMKQKTIESQNNGTLVKFLNFSYTAVLIGLLFYLIYTFY